MSGNGRYRDGATGAEGNGGRIGGGPGWGGDAEARVLARVRALLAKAESTTFPEEAEAFTAKAQELMARHALDEAMIAAVDAHHRAHASGATSQRLEVANPYASAKFLLLSAIADANRCRAVWVREAGVATVFGFPADLAAVEILYTSLLVQATATMLAAGSQVDGWGKSRTRSFRHAFLVSYASRVGERLRLAAAVSEREAAEHYGGDLLPVLVDRKAAVDRALEEAFPEVSTMSASVGNREGWAAGRAAAERASLTVHRQVKTR